MSLFSISMIILYRVVRIFKLSKYKSYDTNAYISKNEDCKLYH